MVKFALNLILFAGQAAFAAECPIPADLPQAPKLVYSDTSIAETLAQAIARQGVDARETLVLASPRNANDIAAFPLKEFPDDNRIETLQALATKYASAKLIIGLGGTKLIDDGRYLARLTKARFIGVATILSTTGPSVDRSVIHVGDKNPYLKGAIPTETIVHVPSITSMPPGLLASSNAAGAGDLLAGLSAAVDRGARTDDAISKDVPQDTALLNLITRDFTTWNAEAIKHLACELHIEGLRVIRAAGHTPRTAGEHALFNELVLTNADVASGKPSHGLIAAIGTLIALKIYAEETSQTKIYDQTKAAFAKLGLPVTWADLNKAGLTREMLTTALHAATKRPMYLQSHFTDGVLDRLF